MSKKILVPVDGSTHSMRAAEQAIYFSGLMSASIILVHCHKKIPSVIGEPYLQRVLNDILKATEELIEPYREIFRKNGVEFTERIFEGGAGKVIPNVAEIEKCDMIIMGTRGLSDLTGLIIGSITHRVLHLAHCPVLVVR